MDVTNYAFMEMQTETTKMHKLRCTSSDTIELFAYFPHTVLNLKRTMQRQVLCTRKDSCRYGRNFFFHRSLRTLTHGMLGALWADAGNTLPAPYTEWSRLAPEDTTSEMGIPACLAM